MVFIATGYIVLRLPGTKTDDVIGLVMGSEKFHRHLKFKFFRMNMLILCAVFLTATVEFSLV